MRIVLDMNVVYDSQNSHMDHLSGSSMDTKSSFYSNSHGFELDFDARLRFHMENIHGAKIYKDPFHKYVVKIEDHPSDFDPSPWVIFQGDRFMGRDVTYLVEK